MAQTTRTAATTPDDTAAPVRSTIVRPRPIVSAWDVVPIVPNLAATAATFLFLIVAPPLCLMAFECIWSAAVTEDPIAAYLLLSPPEDSLVHAALGAGVLLLIGAVLQVRRHHRHFPARWPILAAILIAWVGIIPEALARGGSVVSGGVVGTAIALAFAIHWGLAVGLAEILD